MGRLRPGLLDRGLLAREGDIGLSDKSPPTRCRIRVAGSGTLGHGEGHATFTLAPGPDGNVMMHYAGECEIGGLVAGVGQRILKGVAKHLIGQFFTALRREVAAPPIADTHSMKTTGGDR